MIQGLHGLFYTPEAEAARAFFRDQLGLPHVDAGEGWLVFGVPRGEFGVHPGEKPGHQLSFWCDDIEETVATLRQRGVRFTSEVVDAGWGLTIDFEIPGGLTAALYEPRHAQP